MNKDIEKYTIDHNSSIFKGLETIDKNNKKCLVVLNEEKILGTVTDGDIRRTLLKGSTIDSNIKDAMNKNFLFILDSEDEESKIFRQYITTYK